MLKIRVIPTLLLKNLGLVKGKGFDSWRRVGTVLPAIKVYNTREVDELILVDITATEEKRDPDYEEIKSFSGECFVPLTVGGGVSKLEQITELLRVGADKVSMNTIAFENKKIMEQAARKYGCQCIVASIDAKKESSGKYLCMSHSGKVNTGIRVEDWCKQVEDLGAGDILLTSIDRDGTMQGYDLELISRVTKRVRIPVIASGGAGNYEHMHQAIQAGASAVAAAAMFHYTEHTPLEAKKYLATKGLPVRNANVKNESNSLST